MKDSFDQQAGHRPRPSMGSRQAGQSGGRARSSAVRNTARAASAARLTGAEKVTLTDGCMTPRYRPIGKMSSSTKAMQSQDTTRSERLAAVSYTHLRAHETGRNLVCRLL